MFTEQPSLGAALDAKASTSNVEVRTRTPRTTLALGVAAAGFLILITRMGGMARADDLAQTQAALTKTQAELATTQAKLAALQQGAVRRVPAEWEPQHAVWLQWPRLWEYDDGVDTLPGGGTEDVRSAFANIVKTIAQYEDVHLVVQDEAMEAQVRHNLTYTTLRSVTFHHWETDSSWMRDNGPVYVEYNGEIRVQNYEFDAWGGGFDDLVTQWKLPYAADNGIPGQVATYLGVPVHHVPLVHERGDLEANGLDTVIVSWSVLSQRNPLLSKHQITAQLKVALGVQSVIYIEGFDAIDGTRGHVDGMVRFVSADTILVAKDGENPDLLDSVAAMIAEQRPDLTIDRLQADSANLFMNYLVGNGFVIVGDSGDPEQNSYAQATLQNYYPDRAFHFVNVDALWINGGGIHCVTNDQPADGGVEVVR
jgi:agmatine deiminase